MAKDSPSRQTSTARLSRTDELRREIDESIPSMWRLGARLKGRAGDVRTLVLNGLIWLGFIAVVSATAVWTREQPRVDVGRVMNQTKVARSDFLIIDEAATDAARKNAAARAPRVYNAVSGVLEELRASLESLPTVALGVEDPMNIEAGLRQQFGITAESLAALQKETVDGKASPAWLERVARLSDALVRTPILERETFQLESTAQNREIELRYEPTRSRTAGTDGVAEPARPATSEATAAGGPGRVSRRILVNSTAALSVESPRLAAELRSLVAGTGFSGVLQDLVVTRLTTSPRPTYVYDLAATEENQDRAAANEAEIPRQFKSGELIYRRGEVLTEGQLDIVEQAVRAERASMGVWQMWASRIAVAGLVTAVALAAAGYTTLFVGRVRRNPMRLLALTGLIAGATMVGCWATATKPGLIALTGIAPTVFVTVILALAYNQRVALAYGCLHGVLMGIALDQPFGLYVVMVTGIGVAVWQLKEVRDRDAFIRMGLCEALALAAGTFLINLLELPPTRAAVQQAGWDAGLAGFGGLLVSGVTLYILPTLERTFGLVTGMTLVELRDPKQPLLRQLQQRAPGTYNHSLNVASLGEAAAHAIGADSLLTYVGALYHDIGKMNKPDYFVENQAPGFNRHDKLSPAMSLLVIVGHVKDGMELAREFNLPRPLHHFIEAHHGTTLVEYFYHRAKRQAEAAARAGGDSDEEEAPSEIEYRYPGPRPRTKEVAILMVCDAVESAARAMADPTPSRIDATVRAIANKRLMDGQFDECDLTLRELNTIVETVSKTLASIYHGRIQYPTSEPTEGPVMPAAAGPKTAVVGVGGSAGAAAPAGSRVGGVGVGER